MTNQVTLSGVLFRDPKNVFANDCWAYTRVVVQCDEVIVACATTDVTMKNLLRTVKRGAPITIKGSLTNDHYVQIDSAYSPDFVYPKIPNSVQDIDDVWWD